MFQHNHLFPNWNKGVAKDFAFSLYELDWDVFGIHIEGAVNRVPCLESTGIKSTVCGPESFTPDHKPILGEDPRVRGFFHGCGFNSGGMMFGKWYIKVLLIGLLIWTLYRKSINIWNKTSWIIF